MTRPAIRVALVTPGVPLADGKGYQRRALEIVDALSGAFDVEVLTLPDPSLVRFVVVDAWRLVTDWSLPAQVLWTRQGADHGAGEALSGYDVVIFVTARACGAAPLPGSIVDFVDSCGLAARRRSSLHHGPKRWLWGWEARRMERWEMQAAALAARSVAVSSVDAAHIGRSTDVIPLAARQGAPAAPVAGGAVVFTGNLRFPPNARGAEWVCRSLVPALERRGIEAGRVVIAGRGPSRRLQRDASRSGVELLADVPDMSTVLARAAVAIAPLPVATGMQIKVLEAVASGTPTVLSSAAAVATPLEDGVSTLVRPLDPEGFADATRQLLEDPELRSSMAARAREAYAAFDEVAVRERWRVLVREVAGGRRRGESGGDVVVCQRG